jgi:hypothetical protein
VPLPADVFPYWQVLQPAVSEVQPASDSPQPSTQLRLLHVDVPVQATSHAHDGPQRTLRHDRLPVQSTLHAPAPHVTPWQLWAPLQVIAHAMSLGQVMPLRHEDAIEHTTLQFHPSGQTTAWAQPPLSPQSIVQVRVLPTHDVHVDGHAGAGASGGVSITTQNPSTQVRLFAQAVWSSQVKSPLR